ncbi:MAG: hypothetical protein HY319_23310 [Armatimonadetes bacterium]|nr:hypothetical protein [Armatimonadota bacterium]
MSQETLGEGLSAYLTEVEEDAPGRDVGRFADRSASASSWAGRRSGIPR